MPSEQGSEERQDGRTRLFLDLSGPASALLGLPSYHEGRRAIGHTVMKVLATKQKEVEWAHELEPRPGMKDGRWRKAQVAIGVECLGDSVSC